MKKVLTFILVALAITALFVSCDDPKHEHSYGTEWKSNETEHWHECECGAKKDEAAHTWSKWENSEDLSSSSRSCSVCNRTEKRDGVVSWDGKIYTETDGLYEFEDAAKSYGKFYIHKQGQDIWGDISTSSADASCKQAAEGYIAYFDSLFVNTGKMEFEFIKSDNFGRVVVTVNSADAFAAIRFIKGYIIAKAIKETTGVVAGGEWQGYINTQTIKVTTDIDLDNKEWEPFSLDYSIDFQNHIVSNLNCVRTNEDEVGLFKGLHVATISNLTLKNVVVEGRTYVGAVAGIAKDSLPSISNVKVVNATVKGNQWVGGITGYAYANIKGCSVEGSTIEGLGGIDELGQIGGIVGFQCSGDVTDCTVSGCKIYGDGDVGGIAGRTFNQDNTPINVKNNTVSDTEVTAKPKTGAEEKASKFIGGKSNYVGWISGGEYLPDNDGWTFGLAYTGNGGQCEIKNNTVDGVKH